MCAHSLHSRNKLTEEQHLCRFCIWNRSLSAVRRITMRTHVFILGRRSLNGSISVLDSSRELAEVHSVRSRLLTLRADFLE